MSEGEISWFHPSTIDIGPKKLIIPQRVHSKSETLKLIIASAIFHSKSQLFVILQNEDGDLFQVSFKYSSGKLVESIELCYFDTIPVCSTLSFFKSGFLFAGFESSATPPSLFQIISLAETSEILSNSENGHTVKHYTPTILQNLYAVSKLGFISGGSLIDAKVLSNCGLTGEFPQFLTALSGGSFSSLNVLRYGIEPTESAGTELPATPTAIFTLKGVPAEANRTSEEDIPYYFHSHLVVSFTNATAVLSIGGEDLSEVSDTGLLNNGQTLFAGQLFDYSIIQVTPNRVRHIRLNKSVTEWMAPKGSLIDQVTSNERQLVISLKSSNELVCFMMDASGALIEIANHKKVSSPITCLALEPHQPEKLRSKYLSVGCLDSTLRIYEFTSQNDDAETLQDCSIQVLADFPTVTLFIREEENLSLYVGLNNGLFLTFRVGGGGGELEEQPRMRFMGTGPVYLYSLPSQRGFIIRCSERLWICGNTSPLGTLLPLLFNGTTFTFLTEYISESSGIATMGFVGICGSGNEMKIYSIDSLKDTFTTSTIPLRCSPKSILVHEEAPIVAVLQSEPGIIEEYSLLQELKSLEVSKDGEDMEIEEESAPNINEEELDVNDVFKPLLNSKRFSGNNEDFFWTSCIQLFISESHSLQSTSQPLFELNLPVNEALLCGHFTTFHDKSDRYLVFGTATNLQLPSYKYSQSFIYTYKLVSKVLPDGSSSLVLELIHRTESTEWGVPLSFASYHGRLLVGFSRINSEDIGAALRLYDLGMKKLLLKCHLKVPSCVGLLKIHVPAPKSSYRIMLTDLQESVIIITYRPMENIFLLMADDAIQRWVSTSLCLDYHSMAVASKFGQFSIIRLDSSLSREIDYDETGSKLLAQNSTLGGAPYKLDDVVVNTFIGDTIMAFQSTCLVYGANTPVLVYFTLTGKIGAFIPMPSRSDLFFFQKLESALGELFHSRFGVDPMLEEFSLSGHQHLRYLSSFSPNKDVIDGALLDCFFSLPTNVKEDIAMRLERSVLQVTRKIQDFRLLCAF